MSKAKRLFYLILSIGLLLILTATISAQAEEEQNLVSLDSKITISDGISVVDCPQEGEFNEADQSRTIMQIIDNQFHKWKEYDLEVTGSFFIVMEKPVYRHLTAEEAFKLLESSNEWVQQAKTFNLKSNMENQTLEKASAVSIFPKLSIENKDESLQLNHEITR